MHLVFIKQCNKDLKVWIQGNCKESTYRLVQG